MAVEKSFRKGEASVDPPTQSVDVISRLSRSFAVPILDRDY